MTRSLVSVRKMAVPTPLSLVRAVPKSSPRIRPRLTTPLLVASTVPPESSSISSSLSFSSNCSTMRRKACPRAAAVSRASPAVPVACKRPSMAVNRLSMARCTPPYKFW